MMIAIRIKDKLYVVKQSNTQFRVNALMSTFTMQRSDKINYEIKFEGINLMWQHLKYVSAIFYNYYLYCIAYTY